MYVAISCIKRLLLVQGVELKVVLDLFCKLLLGEPTSLQFLQEVPDFDVLILGRLPCLNRLWLSHQFLAIEDVNKGFAFVFIKQVEHFLDLVRIRALLCKLLTLVKEQVKLRTLLGDCLFELFALHPLLQNNILEELQIVVQVSILLPSCPKRLLVKERDVTQKEGALPDCVELLLEKHDCLVLVFDLLVDVARFQFESLDVLLDFSHVVLQESDSQALTM